MELLSKLKQEQRKHVYPVSFSCMYGKNEPTKGQSETIRYQVRRNFQRWWKTGEGDKQRIYGFRHYKTYALLWTYYSESYRFVQLKFARKYNFKWEIELLSQNYFNTSSYYISLTPQSTRVFKKRSCITEWIILSPSVRGHGILSYTYFTRWKRMSCGQRSLSIRPLVCLLHACSLRISF